MHTSPCSPKRFGRLTKLYNPSCLSSSPATRTKESATLSACVPHTHTHSHPQERSPESHRVVTNQGAVLRKLGATGVFGGHPWGSLPDPAPKLWWLCQATFACVLKLYNLFLTHDQREGKPAREKNINLFSKFEQVFLKRGGRGFVYKGKRLCRGCQSAWRAMSSHHNSLAGSSEAGHQDGALGGGGSPKTPGPEDGTLEA